MKRLDFLVLLLLLSSPVIINYLILGTALNVDINGSLDGWLSFYGALVGSLITMFVLYRTRRWNNEDNTETRKQQSKILQYQAKRVWLEGLRKQLEENYRNLNFQDTIEAIAFIVSGDCRQAMSYLQKLNRNIEIQGFNFDLYFSNDDLHPVEHGYANCYGEILQSYGSYINDLILICGIKLNLIDGSDVVSYINDSVNRLQELNRLNKEIAPSEFLMKLSGLVNQGCTLTELSEICTSRTLDYSVIHSSKTSLLQATKDLLRFEEKQVEGILI